MPRVLSSQPVRPNHHGRIEKLLIYFSVNIIAFLIVFAQAQYFNAFSSGFSGADESAHFINSYFAWSVLSDGVSGDLLDYAREFYAAYPKLSIGHWPPLYYLFVGLLFFAVPPIPESAMVLNLVLSVAPVFLIVHLVQLVTSWRWAFFAGLAYVTMPLSTQAVWFFMLDQPVALLCLAGAVCWQSFAQSPRYLLALGYGVLAAAAILVKGNGWVLALFPVFHIVLGGHWHLLRTPPTYAAAVLAIVAVLPWYVMTYKISSDGFNFDFGFEYAIQAFVFNIGVLVSNLGVFGFGLALGGAIFPFIQTPRSSLQRQVALMSVSLILATFALQSLLPVALAPRYMAPAMPFALILAIMGANSIAQISWMLRHRGLRCILSFLAAMLLLAPGLSFLYGERPQRNLRMADAAERVILSARPDIIVIDGSSGAEGAFIAEVMVRTDLHDVLIVRSSKLLSKSDFMGSEYNLIAKTSSELATKLTRLGASFIVIERHKNGVYYAHNSVLEAYLNSRESFYRKIESFSHWHRDGVTDVYVPTVRVSPNLNMARSINVPQKSLNF
jgi:hypothetical protein